MKLCILPRRLVGSKFSSPTLFSCEKGKRVTDEFLYHAKKFNNLWLCFISSLVMNVCVLDSAATCLRYVLSRWCSLWKFAIVVYFILSNLWYFYSWNVLFYGWGSRFMFFYIIFRLQNCTWKSTDTVPFNKLWHRNLQRRQAQRYPFSL